jgi:hypothetical protein
LKRITTLANVYLTIAASALLWVLFLVLIPVAAGYGRNQKLEAMYRGMHQGRPAHAEADPGRPSDEPGTPLAPGREAERYRLKKEASRNSAVTLLLAILIGAGAGAVSLKIQSTPGRGRAVASVLSSLAVSIGVGLALALASLPFIIVALMVLLSD